MPFSHLYSIDYLQKFDFLSEEYCTLFENSQATTFQSPLWLHHMYKSLIPAVGVDPIIVTIRDTKSQHLLLVLPLVRTRYAGMACIEPADLGICDYNAVVASNELETQFFADSGLREQVVKGLKPYHLIFFRKMPGECDIVGHVMGDAKIGEMDSSSHEVKLWAPFEDWKQKTMSSSFRKELRRKRRKLEQHGEVRFEVIKDPAEIRQAMALLREQRSTRYEDDLLQQDAYFNFYVDFAIAGLQSGEAQTAILWSGNQAAAVEFGIIHDRCYHFLLAGFDEAQFAKSSPGILMIEHILEERIKQGDVRADFTIGDEPYKAKYGATPTELKHMARADTLLGSIAHRAYENGGTIKDVAKKIAQFGRR